MQIEPTLDNFKYVKIRRSGGIAGMDQSILIDERLQAKVNDRFTGDRTFALDAWSAQEMMSALSKLAERRPAASTRTGFDLFQYNIELGWNGTIYKINTVDLGADEAVHGVMLAANRLLHGDREPVHVMTLHTTASEGK